MDRAPATGVLPGATFGGHRHGLDSWFESLEYGMVFWTAPPGTTAVLEVAGAGVDADVDGDVDAAELQWSTRCAELPSTRAVVLLDGPGFEDVRRGFETAHEAAEAVAGFVTGHSGADAGPIEVLVFRPDAADATGAMDTAAAADATGARDTAAAAASTGATDTSGSAASMWPQPIETSEGAEFRFRHRGGAVVRLRLAIPQITSTPTREA